MAGEVIGIDAAALVARMEPGGDPNIIRQLINALEVGTLEGVAEAKDLQNDD